MPANLKRIAIIFGCSMSVILSGCANTENSGNPTEQEQDRSKPLVDRGIGDMFVARVAGNFENTDILGSMEFACKVSGSKLVFVLGPLLKETQ